MLLRKDIGVKLTINKIFKILKDNNIEVKIKHNNFNKIYYSCRVFFKRYPILGTNGKGVSKLSAMASGLAEFMERLQTFKLVKPTFCKLDSEFINRLNTLDFYTFKNELDFIKLNTENLEKIKSISLVTKTIKYLDYFADKNTELPYFLVNGVTDTNGYCAGNSFEEAVSQGMCEIFERHCLKHFFQNSLKVPTIDINGITNPDILQQFQQLKDNGFEIVLKDLSRGIYPVIGTIIIKKDDQYLFAGGSDPDINIAIQRCLSEIFQGLNDTTYKNKLQNFVDSENYSFENFYRMYLNNSAKLSTKVLDGKLVSVDILPFKNCINSKDSFNFLTQILKNYNLRLFVKDYSILDLPTYHVYIPGLSEIRSYDECIETLINKLDLKKYFFNINKLSQSDVENFLGLISKQKFNRCGEYFHLDSMFVDKLNNLNNIGLKKLVKQIYSLENDEEFAKISKDINTIRECKDCAVSKKCYYKIWTYYSNILLQKSNKIFE